MYNDLSKLKLNLMLVRKASIRVAFFLFIVYLITRFAPLQGWFFEELANVSLFGSALLLFLCVTMAFLEEEVQKILNKSQFSFGAGHYQPFGFGNHVSFEEYKDAMQEYTAEDSSDRSDDLFTPVDEGINPEDDKSEEDRDYWKNKLESIPERTRSDFKERVTALRDLTEKRFDLLRNEFLAHVFGTPEGDELPEGQDALTFNPKAYHCGIYVSNVLLDMYGGEWLHYKNRLKTLFQDDYKIDFDDEGNVSYQLK